MKKTETIRLTCIFIMCALCLAGCGKSESKNADLSTEADDMEIAETYEEFDWPKSDIASLIPIPESNIGKVEWEASYGFVIYVAETLESDFKAYADACYERGFQVNYQRGDDYFYADNENGYHLSLQLQDGNIMFIRLDEPEDIENTDATNIDPTDSENEGETSQAISEDIRPEFKELLDSYEAFMDEYCEFMKKYADSDNVLSMMEDYTDIMAKYVEFSEKIGALEGKEMNNAEAAYYAEVMLRVSEKLIEVSQ